MSTSIKRALVTAGLMLYGAALVLGFIFLSLVLMYVAEQVWMIL